MEPPPNNLPGSAAPRPTGGVDPAALTDALERLSDRQRKEKLAVFEETKSALYNEYRKIRLFEFVQKDLLAKTKEHRDSNGVCQATCIDWIRRKIFNIHVATKGMPGKKDFADFKGKNLVKLINKHAAMHSGGPAEINVGTTMDKVTDGYFDRGITKFKRATTHKDPDAPRPVPKFGCSDMSMYALKDRTIQLQLAGTWDNRDYKHNVADSLIYPQLMELADTIREGASASPPVGIGIFMALNKYGSSGHAVAIFFDDMHTAYFDPNFGCFQVSKNLFPILNSVITDYIGKLYVQFGGWTDIEFFSVEYP